MQRKHVGVEAGIFIVSCCICIDIYNGLFLRFGDFISSPEQNSENFRTKAIRVELLRSKFKRSTQ
jgi:hypothetical protein